MKYRQANANPAIDRRTVLVGALCVLFSTNASFAAEPVAGSEERFNFLSANGNSNCSQKFRESIAAMPGSARLEGSCCGPMALHRYKEQVKAAKEFAVYPEVPADPYDIEAGFAARMMQEYKRDLIADDLMEYNAAMAAAAEGGPCCCKCWRWEVLGGMGKVLVRDRRIDGKTLARIWDITDGCGGDEHVH